MIVKKIIRLKKKDKDKEKDKDKDKNKVEDKIEEPKKPVIKRIVRTPSITHNNVKMRVPTPTPKLEDDEEKTRKKYNDSINQIRFTWVNTPEKEQEIIEKAKKGKEKLDIIKTLNKDKEESELELISIPEEIYSFEEAIEIYENNQNYWYSLFVKDKDRSILEELIKLEEWFIVIPETMPELFEQEGDEEDIIEQRKEEMDSWRKRELFKMENWRSYYCMDELKSIIKVENPKIQNRVKRVIKEYCGK